MASLVVMGLIAVFLFLEAWPAVVASYDDDTASNGRVSLSGNHIPRVAVPRFEDHGELVRFWRRENLPGKFPFTAGVFPFKRADEDPARLERPERCRDQVCPVIVDFHGGRLWVTDNPTGGAIFHFTLPVAVAS